MIGMMLGGWGDNDIKSPHNADSPAWREILLQIPGLTLACKM